MDQALRILLILAGIFTMVLGSIHLFLPRFLDYRAYLIGNNAKPRLFSVPVFNYPVTDGDRYGIIWVMNHAASYGLISIGLVDIFAGGWLMDAGWPVALWIAGWWEIRSLTQFYLGARRGDWIIAAFFLSLGLLHLGVVLL